MTSAPFFTSNRTALRISSGPSAIPWLKPGSCPNSISRKPDVLSKCPPVAPMPKVATNIRGPTTRPLLIELRRATSTNSGLPTNRLPRSRTVVKPASTVARANAVALIACSETLRSSSFNRRLLKSPQKSRVRCECPSMNPGDKVVSPRSITCASLGIGKLLPASTILLPCTITTPLLASVFDLPSNKRAALSAIIFSGSAPWLALTPDRRSSPIKPRRTQWQCSFMAPV